jgi:hypothetical protein
MMSTRSQFAARIALVPLGLAFAVAALAHAASGSVPGMLESVQPLRSSLNANELTELADGRFRREMNQAAGSAGVLPELSPDLVELAREAYAVDPLEVSTLRTIALNAVQQGADDRGRQLMRLAAQISKRDELVNLWLAQDYARSGDVGPMTASFDHALRTSARAREVAMKPVVDALASAESHVPLGDLLARRPEWEGAFWREFARNPVALANAAKFFATTKITMDRVPAEDRQLLYANLKATRQFDTLASLAALDPEARQGAEGLAAGGFVTADEGNPLAWTLHSRGTYVASVRGDPRVLEIDARPGSFGLAADRIVPGGGSFRLSIAMAEPVPENATLELAAACPGEEATALGEISLGPGERTGEGTISAAGCDYASLQLLFSVDQGRRDALIRVARIALSSR